MNYYKDAINDAAGMELCAKVSTSKGKTRVLASRKTDTIGLWCQLISAARAVLGEGSGAVIEWPHGEKIL